MIKNNRVLVIKLSPVKGLNSSMMRALAVVKGLVEKGYIVDFLTLHASATHVLNEKEYSFLQDVNIIYANSNKAYSAIVAGSNNGLKKIIVNMLRRIYHSFSLFDYSISIANKINISILPSKEYEYVFSISDPKTTHIAAKKLIEQGLRYNEVVEYWGDPLYGDITLKSIYPGFVYKYVERKLLSFADRIVYTSPFTLKEEQELYPEYKDKMMYTPTAYLEKKILPPRIGKYTVGYYGAYPSNVRNILPLYEACKNMKNDVDLIVVGNTDLVLDNTSNIEIYPRGDISSFETKTDLFVCILNRKGTQIPGKLYHYAAYNRPVLVVEDGDFSSEMRSFISSFNRYYYCMNDKESIKKRIYEIMQSQDSWDPYEKMAPKYIVDNMLKQ